MSHAEQIAAALESARGSLEPVVVVPGFAFGYVQAAWVGDDQIRLACVDRSPEKTALGDAERAVLGELAFEPTDCTRVLRGADATPRRAGEILADVIDRVWHVPGTQLEIGSVPPRPLLR